MNAHRTARQGWTLIELLVVLAIIGMVLGMALPAIQKARESANVTHCKNNLKQMGLALHQYHDNHKRFPPGYLYNGPPTAGVNPVPIPPPSTPPAGASRAAWRPPGGPFYRIHDHIIPAKPHNNSGPVYPPETPGWGWASLLLPYLEQQPLFQRIDFKTPVEAPSSAPVRTTLLPIYTCPSDPETGIITLNNEFNKAVGDAASNSYAACYGALGLLDLFPDKGNGLFLRNGRLRHADVRDGLSNTLALGERSTILAKTPWAGVVSNGLVTTTPGAPVWVTITDGPPTQVLARVSNRELMSANSEPYDFFSPHGNFVLFVFADGSVHAIGTQVSVPVLIGLATRDGGEAVSDYDY